MSRPCEHVAQQKRNSIIDGIKAEFHVASNLQWLLTHNGLPQWTQCSQNGYCKLERGSQYLKNDNGEKKISILAHKLLKERLSRIVAVSRNCEEQEYIIS